MTLVGRSGLTGSSTATESRNRPMASTSSPAWSPPPRPEGPVPRFVLAVAFVHRHVRLLEPASALPALGDVVEIGLPDAIEVGADEGRLPQRHRHDLFTLLSEAAGDALPAASSAPIFG